MILLSLCDNHDSGACILKDGELLFAVNEERLSRKKLQGGFPRLSIREFIKEGFVPLRALYLAYGLGKAGDLVRP